MFDVDGTLVDSERDGHRVAFNSAFAHVGLPHRWDVDAYGELLEITGGRRRLETFLIRQGHPAREAAHLSTRLHVIKNQAFGELIEQERIPLRPGVHRLVEELTVNGVRLFVATTGSKQWVQPLLDQHFGAGRFELVITGADVDRLKPHPEAYLQVVHRGRLNPGRTVVVEDSRNGLEAARGAWLPCLVVTNDYTRNHDLQHADMVVDDYGPPAQHVHGLDAPLPGGAVTVETIAALAALC